MAFKNIEEATCASSEKATRPFELDVTSENR